jgi:hypothetical protein
MVDGPHNAFPLGDATPSWLSCQVIWRIDTIEQIRESLAISAGASLAHGYPGPSDWLQPSHDSGQFRTLLTIGKYCA